MTEKTNKEFVQIPFGDPQTSSVSTTTTEQPISTNQDVSLLVEREVPADHALSQATVRDLWRIGRPWRDEITRLEEAGFSGRAKTEPDQPRSVELKTKDGSTLRFDTTYTAITKELKKMLQEAGDREEADAEELDREFDRLDNMGSMPTHPLSEEILEKRRRAKQLKNGT